MGNECMGCVEQVAEAGTDGVGKGAGSPDDEKFVDNEFPPDESSLMVGDGGDTYVDLFPEEIEMLKGTSFMRVTEYYQGKSLAVFNDIGPNDINQGQLGDCYYLSAVSALAEFPDRIKACFVTQNFNYAGKYTVRLFVNGQKRTYVIDDFFATNKSSGAWQFSYSKEDEIWVQLLEKAWAKANGTYAKIIGGLTGEALTALTGGPSRRYEHKDTGVEELWDAIFTSD